MQVHLFGESKLHLHQPIVDASSFIRRKRLVLTYDASSFLF
ncbi:hypothetical protein CU014_1955 [Enterococcus xinjiangensis]|nr:hypothetical protein [Enterococcus lactis]